MENPKQIKNTINNIDENLRSTTTYTGDLIGSILYDIDKEIKNDSAKTEMINDIRELFGLLYDKAEKILTRLKYHYELAITEEKEIDF